MTSCGWLALMLTLAACGTPRDFVYSEGDALPGVDLPTRLAHVGQLDQLDDTEFDVERCSCAAGLTAYLLLGGEFAPLAERFGVGAELTFANVHRLQEALFRACTGDRDGLLGSSVPEFDAEGRVTGWRPHANDKFHLVAEALGLDYEPLYGPTKDSLSDRRKRVEAAVAAAPRAAFVIGCSAGDPGTRVVAPDDAHPANHYALVLAEAGRFWIYDSYCLPGNLCRRELTQDEVRALLWTNRLPPYWMRVRAK